MHIDLRTVEGLAEPPGYAHVAIADGSRLVFTAGAVPLDDSGELVGSGDAEAQTEQVIANLVRQLQEGGASPSDVVKTTVYVAGASHETQSAVWKVVQRSPLAPVPSTLVGVALLGYRGQLVEIEAIAVIAG
jgi:enamine deaminase RidA (YjgF/YER057c/UK114 family)